jgi:hypothetical protein
MEVIPVSPVELRISPELSRSAHYARIRSDLEELWLRSTHPKEQKALLVLRMLALFVQGSRRWPRRSELDEAISDVLDRNLERTDFVRKWHLRIDTEEGDLSPEEVGELFDRMARYAAWCRDSAWSDYHDGQ